MGDGAPPGHARSAASSSRTVTGRECLAASTARLRPQPRGWHGAAPRSDAFRSGTRDPLVTGRKRSSRLPTAWRSPSHGQGEATHTPARPEAAARPGGGRKTRASSEGLAQNPPASQADVSVEHTNSLCATGHLLGDRAVHLSNAPLLCGLRLAPGCAWYGSRRPSSYRLATTMPLAGGFCAFLAGRTGQSILGLDVTDRNANASVQTRSPVPPRQLGATESSRVHGRRSEPCRPVSADCTPTPKTPWRRPPGAQHFPSFGYDSQCRLWTDDETKTPEQPSGVGSAE